MRQGSFVNRASLVHKRESPLFKVTNRKWFDWADAFRLAFH